MFVFRDNLLALPGFDRDRDDLRCEPLPGDRAHCLLLAIEREGILLAAADLIFGRNIFGGNAHAATAERIGERSEQPIGQPGIPHLLALAQAVDRIGGTAHDFGAYGEREPAFTGPDHRSCRCDCLGARAAESVKREARCRGRQAAFHADHAPEVKIARRVRNDVAGDGIVEIGSGNTRAFNR
ncbi:hypothetical protein D3C73_825450 [compost metagenome]